MFPNFVISRDQGMSALSKVPRSVERLFHPPFTKVLFLLFFRVVAKTATFLASDTQFFSIFRHFVPRIPRVLLFKKLEPKMPAFSPYWIPNSLYFPQSFPHPPLRGEMAISRLKIKSEQKRREKIVDLQKNLIMLK